MVPMLAAQVSPNSRSQGPNRKLAAAVPSTTFAKDLAERPLTKPLQRAN